MTALALSLAGIWLLVVVPYAVWDGRRPYVPGPPVRPVDRGDEVLVHHLHHVQHEHVIRHVHEVRATAEQVPVTPRVVEGAVVQTRELPR